MTTTRVLRALSSLAPGRRMTVVVGGKAHELPLTPQAEPDHKTDEINGIVKEFLKRDAETLTAIQYFAAAVEGIAQKMDESSSAVNSALLRMSENQSDMSDGIKSVAATLARPVRPVYDEKGRLAGAVRDES